jgi:hypothetical protein
VTSNDGNPNGEPADEPVAELVNQEKETAPDFLSRVRNKIRRRSAASQLAAYSWHVPKLVLLEMASILSYVFAEFGGRKDSQR